MLIIIITDTVQPPLSEQLFALSDNPKIVIKIRLIYIYMTVFWKPTLWSQNNNIEIHFCL